MNVEAIREPTFASRAMKRGLLGIAILIIQVSPAAGQVGAIIADHTSVAEFEAIPESWIQQAKADFRISYGHTSHGSQITTGLQQLGGVTAHFSMDDCAWYSPTNPLYAVCDDYESSLPPDTLSYWHRRMPPATQDLGYPDFTSWSIATRTHLEGVGSDRNLIMWSWCGQLSTATEADVQTYLDTMSGLEADYPGVLFIYMTGHVDGTGPDGNLRHRNDQIRDHVIANAKVLFDFADIESYDPDGVYHPDATDACEWCSTWCSTHSCPGCDSCEHSHCFNCFLKGRAFWWMMARLAGWDGVADGCACVLDEGCPLRGDANRDGVVDGLDYTIWADNFGMRDARFDDGDFNCDGTVDGGDYTWWADNFGSDALSGVEGGQGSGAPSGGDTGQPGDEAEAEVEHAGRGSGCGLDFELGLLLPLLLVLRRGARGRATRQGST